MNKRAIQPRPRPRCSIMPSPCPSRFSFPLATLVLRPLARSQARGPGLPGVRPAVGARHRRAVHAAALPRTSPGPDGQPGRRLAVDRDPDRHVHGHGAGAPVGGQPRRLRRAALRRAGSSACRWCASWGRCSRRSWSPAASARAWRRPTRFSDADSATAAFGVSAPVAIELAIALPVSWKPLVKSKARAVITTMNNKNSSTVTGLILAIVWLHVPRFSNKLGGSTVPLWTG